MQRWAESEEHPRALAQALAIVGRARVPVTVRILTVILGSSSGGHPKPTGAT
jgi:hypothetical protein